MFKCEKCIKLYLHCNLSIREITFLMRYFFLAISSLENRTENSVFKAVFGVFERKSSGGFQTITLPLFRAFVVRLVKG